MVPPLVPRTTITARRAVACFLAALAALVAVPPATAAGLDRVERRVLERFDGVRARAGLPPLRANRDLTRAARAHNRDMLAADFFDHASSDGRSMVDRVLAYRPARVVGEVLGLLPGGGARGQARAVVRLWLASPGHRAAILTGGYRRVGLDRRRGSLDGVRVTVFTVDFASAR